MSDQCSVQPTAADAQNVAVARSTQHQARWIKRIALASAAALVFTGTLSCSSRPRSEDVEGDSSESRSQDLQVSSSLPADYVRLAQLLASGYFREDGKPAVATAPNGAEL